MCRSAVTARGGQWCRSACWWSWTWRWANNIRSSVLVELDLEEEYQRVNGVGLQSQRVGLQSQREAISAVVDERAGGANNIRSSVLVGPTISVLLIMELLVLRCWCS